MHTTLIDKNSYLAEYFGVWAVLEAPFRAAVDRLQGLPIGDHLQRVQATQAAAGGPAKAGTPTYPVIDGVAVISISGSMMKFQSSLSDGTSTALVRRQVRAAAADDSVSGILLAIDSPGGTVSGTRDLADDIAAAAKQKPVYAYIEDMGASAAYWAASQATKVYSNASALVGSIGTFAVIQDQSGAAAQLGIKVHVIRAGEFKGSGTPGTEVTRAQLDEWQRVVNELNDQFLSAVASGRKLSAAQVKELADGRVHVGAAAQAIGLTDGVMTFPQTLGQLQGLANPPSTKGKKNMAEENSPAVATAPAPAPIAAVAAPLKAGAATYHEIVAAAPGCDEKFICRQLAAGSNLDNVRANYAAEQQQQLAALRAENEQLKAQAAKPGHAAHVPNAKGASDGGADSIAAWNQLVQSHRDKGCTKQQAVAKASAEQPELHDAFIAASQPARPSRK